jgi:D-serine deaminase-like pyridoxal phosphate-dependent protein
VATTSAAPIDARLGRPKTELDTPSLLLDLERFEANVERLSSAIAAGGKDWRPHSKGH